MTPLERPIGVVLADDDVEMLDFLENLVDWNAMGFEILARGTDGLDALRRLRDRPADLLLSDITMPGMDGYALAAALRERNPDVQALFFTCHEDFDHARRAIHAGAEAYLVKYTLNGDTLSRELMKAAATVRQARTRRERENAFDESLVSARESLIYETVKVARTDPERMRERFALYKMGLRHAQFCLIAIYADGGTPLGAESDLARTDSSRPDSTHLTNGQPADAAAWRHELAARMGESFQTDGIADHLFFYGSQVILLHGWDDPPALEDRYVEILARNLKAQGDERAVRLVALRGVLCRSLVDIPAALADLAVRREAQFYNQNALLLQETVQSPNYAQPSPEAMEETLSRLLTPFRARGDFPRALEDVAASLCADRIAPSSVRRLFEGLIRRMRETDGSVPHDQPPVQLEGSSFAACLAAVQSVYARFKRAEVGALAYAERPDIRRALRYVEAHLREDLSLRTLAEKLHISAGYLSRLFRKHTGVSYSEYLIKRRVARATELLRDGDLSMEEVAERVGIENVNYFYRFYKRETGMTPGSARKGGAGK
ncbi:MAG: helix-turn-helix domain-containing protein [Oscillospiraceae bacterium]|jgi:AraC-like DNA-binding protein/DNA-binding NarL/FixJ family response regulator|nr:helix-turn-helix domain-containing protein [Oscillospiraceae bacterium]